MQSLWQRFLFLKHSHLRARDSLIPGLVHEAVKIVLLKQPSVGLITAQSQTIDSDALGDPS